MALLIVALDVPTLAQARAAAARLAPLGVGYKVGLELWMAHGPDAVRAIAPYGPVFADLKWHDIPHTVEQAARQLARTGPAFVTAHALGGRAMLAAARAGLMRGSRESGLARPRLLAVTILTSHDPAVVAGELGLAGSPSDEAVRLGRLAVEAGADGVVCSPLEAARMRAALGPAALLATPGVRSAGEATGDQRRTATAGEAAAAGANLIVVGRPVLQAPDPVARVQALLREMTR